MILNTNKTDKHFQWRIISLRDEFHRKDVKPGRKQPNVKTDDDRQEREVRRETRNQQNEKVLSLCCVQGLIRWKVLCFAALRSCRQKYCMMYFSKSVQTPPQPFGGFEWFIKTLTAVLCNSDPVWTGLNRGMSRLCYLPCPGMFKTLYDMIRCMIWYDMTVCWGY